MPSPGNLRTIAAGAFAALAIAAVGGGAAVAVATTPTPTPLLTPLPTTSIGKETPFLAPTPLPTTSIGKETPLPQPSSTVFCGGATPGGDYTISTNADGSEVSLFWSIAGSLGGYPDFCYNTPAQYDVLIDGSFVAHVYGAYGASYTARGLEVGSTHTFKVVPTNNSNIQTLSRDYTIVPSTTSTPPPVSTATPTPTPTPAPPIRTPGPPTPVPTPTAGPKLCIDPPMPPLPPLHQITSATTNSVTFSWRVPYGCYDTPLTPKFLVNGQPPASATGTSSGFSGTETISGLTVDTTYSIEIRVVSPSGQETTVDTFPFTPNGLLPTPVPTAQPTPSLTPTPGPPTPLPAQNFSVAGATTLRAKTATGSFSLTGTSSLTVNPAAPSQYGGKVQLAPTTGTLLIAGAFQARATLSFGAGDLSAVNSATNSSGTLTAPLTITKATLFGITLTQNGTCRTIRPVKITLISTATFYPLGGGTFAGNYSPGGFTGCGSLGGFLGATGTTSSIALKLTHVTPTPLPAPAAN